MSVTVFVHTTDQYRAVWPPFCHGFNKYWSDCPWPLRWMTNELDPPCGKAIKTGTDTNWTAMMRKALPQVETPVILSTIDDYWLLAPPDTKTLMEYAVHCVEGRADMVGLWLCASEAWNTEDFPHDSRLFKFLPNAYYRTSMRAAFWRVDALLALLKDGESIWGFETRGSDRSRGNDKIVCVKKLGCFLYPSAVTPSWGDTCVTKGRWSPWARRYAREEGLDIDFSRNPGGFP